MVNKITSTETQLPLDYYSLPFCRPNAPLQKAKENMGQLLSGDLIQNSPYILRMKQEMFCEQVSIANIDQATVEAIKRGYKNNWIVDNLPAASKLEDEYTVTTKYWGGFPIGFIDESDGNVYIHNHVNIEIMYHKVDNSGLYRVVRFTVEPFSIKHEWDRNKTTIPIAIANTIESCINNGTQIHTDWDMVYAKGRKQQEASGNVLFTYDVNWFENQYLEWANRWDIYLTMDNAIPQRVHWFSIMNSVIVAFVTWAIVFCIWRCMVRDIANYRMTHEVSQSTLTDDGERWMARIICLFMCWGLALFYFLWEWLTGRCQRPTTVADQTRGWKAVQADVFRPPRFAPMLLSVACGTGAQLLCTTLFTILISVFGLVSSARRGSLIIAEYILFILMGPISGYVTARLYVTFDGQRRRLASTFAALGFPAFVAVSFNLIYVSAGLDKSTYSVGYQVWGVLIALWLGIMIPLVFVGAYLGYRQKPIRFPIKPSATPRAIPGNCCVRNFAIIPLCLQLCGILPFGAIFVEVYFILAAIWMGQFYYSFGFLAIAFFIMALTCAVMTILFTFLQLCLEDYRWWWRSFNNAGAVAIYVFLYSIIYHRYLDASGSEVAVIYFGFMAVMSLGIFCMTGFIGLLASLWFTKTVYAGGIDDETDEPLVTASAEVQLANIT